MSDSTLSDSEYIELTWKRFEAQKEALEKTAEILRVLGEAVPPAMGFLYPTAVKNTKELLGESMSELVRKAVQSTKGPFTRNDIVNALQAGHPDREVKPLSIGSYLSAMVGDKIEVMTPSEGGMQAVYRKRSSIPD